MDSTVDWLMRGDPVIRWQTMRDLLDSPEADWMAERRRTCEEGWVARFLDQQLPNGEWPRETRWKGTVWTLLVLLDCGTPSGHPAVIKASGALLDRMMPISILPAPPYTSGREDETECGARSLDIHRDRYEKSRSSTTSDFDSAQANEMGSPATPGDAVQSRIDRVDLCHLGFWLRIGSTFTPTDYRLRRVAECLLQTQMSDGGWNCNVRKKPTVHSSFHTTFNVLEGLRAAASAAVVAEPAFAVAEERALEFMLQHQMYRSDKTGKVINERFLKLTNPSYWHYTVLRGLDYMRETTAIRDHRLTDPISWLSSRQKPDGRWCTEFRVPGETYFDMERPGSRSRWSTLRALRVLKARSVT
jgi:hypothetical protein